MIVNSLGIMAPILIAGLGGLLSERAGVLNISLEGLMLTGAFTAVVVTASTGSILLGVIAAVIAGAALALVFSIISIDLGSNIFITGLGINLLAQGAIPFISNQMFGTKGVLRFAEMPILPRLELAFEFRVPLVHELLFGHHIGVYLSILLTALTWFLLYRTGFGLRLRSVGSNPEALRLRGLTPEHYKRIAIVLSGVGAGLGGALLALRLGVYLPNITSGRGWIALVTIYLGYRRPGGVLIAAFVFAFAETVSMAAQGVVALPNTVLLSLPYVLTVIAMVVYSAVRHSGARRHYSR